ncbi:MAG: TonB-dependent receptor [Thermoanaerobaculaceae bacterium]|nr:TonB-dependent receptor [Thermoanaerobaculaceae bacterium]
MRKTTGWGLSGATTLAFVGAIAFAGLALAQEPPKPAQEEPKAEEGRTEYVEEVVVTAQKRSEDIQLVPVAITAVQAQDLAVVMAGGQDIRFLSARVPSLTLESSFGRAFPRFYMRGLGNTDFDLNASQPVSMIVDEVVLENPVVKGMPLFDLDRVEILRGPQGTLFGRNTPAGVIKFETRKPSQEFEADFRLSYGSFDTIDFSGGVGGALTDTISARFSALYQSRSDWVDNKNPNAPKEDALGGYDTTAYRLQLLFEPNDKFKALLNVHGWELDGTARIFRANILKHGSNDLVDDFRQDTVYHDGLNKQEISALGGVLKMDYDFGAATLTSVTGYESIDDMYSRGDIDGGYGAGATGGPGFIPFASESADGIPSLDQITEELRLASNGDGPFRWLLGAYYFKEELDIDSFSYNSMAAGNPQNGYATQWQESTSYALFASVDYAFSEAFSMKAGLRYSNDERDFEADRPQPLFQPPLTKPIERHVEGDNVSGDLSATYKTSENVSLFGRLATGYRAPSIQGRIMFAPDFADGQNPATNGVSVADEEKITSFEVGLKSILADNRLRMNLTAYIFQMDGQQLTAVGGQYNVATLLNADKTDGHGFEADIEYIASANFWVTLGGSWNSTEINDSKLTVAPCGGGCTVLDPAGPNGTVYVDGNSLPNAPEWIFNGILNYQSDPVNKGFFGSLDWAYFSEKNFMLYESEEFRSDGLEVGLRLGYGWSSGKYEVALFGRNILDAEIVEGGIDFNNLTGMTNEPRTVGLEFVARF